MQLKISKGDSLDRIYLLRFLGLGLFAHKIHTTDPADVYHSHPWNGVSIIFGRYTEQFSDGPTKYERVGFNTIKAPRHHRVEVSKPVWTLFLHFRKCNKWSTKDGSNEVEVPWDGVEGFKSYASVLE